MSLVDQMNFERFIPKQSILDTDKGKMNQDFSRQFKDLSSDPKWEIPSQVVDHI